MARFALKYSDVRILSSALQRKAEYTYMNTRQKTKGGTYINRHSSLHFTNFSNFGYRTQSSGFFSKYAEHVVRRTVLAVALQQEKRL